MTVFKLTNDLTPGHEDCAGYIVIGEPVPSLNVSNGNAGNLLALLGIEFDYCGQIGANELLDHIATARTLPHDEFARKTSSVIGPFGVLAIDCGLQASRLSLYLDALEAVARYALERQVTVQWA